MTRYLITGAHGFIGTHLTSYIKRIEPAAEVVAAGREYDLRSAEECTALFEPLEHVHYVFHLADVSGNAAWSSAHSAEQFFQNARISLNVLESVRAFHPAARLVGFTSLWAYPTSAVVAREEDYWSGPLEPSTQHYGLVKKFFGSGLQACKQQHGLRGTILALGSVYGPGDRSDHVIPSLIQRMRDNPSELEIWGDGNDVRDFIYVADQVRGIYLHKDFEGELLNISGAQPASVRAIVATLVDIMSYEGEIKFNLSKGSGGKVRRMDNSRAETLTGWPGNTKLHTLREGLRLTLTSVFEES